MTARTAGLRFRVWVSGELVLEDWAVVSDEAAAAEAGDILGARHSHIAREAHAAGKRWLAELYDPGAAPGEAYLRFGTDTAGMVNPVATVDGFTCPRCHMTSHNPTDIWQRYCGNCHDWTGAGR